MTSPRPTLAERAHWPPVLDPEDLAVVLGLPSERAAKEFIQTHGVPCIRLGQRVYVVVESLVAFFREHEARPPSREELREKADAVIAQIAPPVPARQRERRPPRPKGGELT